LLAFFEAKLVQEEGKSQFVAVLFLFNWNGTFWILGSFVDLWDLLMEPLASYFGEDVGKNGIEKKNN
jgi:hypothetical protein